MIGAFYLGEFYWHFLLRLISATKSGPTRVQSTATYGYNSIRHDDTNLLKAARFKWHFYVQVTWIPWERHATDRRIGHKYINCTQYSDCDLINMYLVLFYHLIRIYPSSGVFYASVCWVLRRFWRNNLLCCFWNNETQDIADCEMCYTKHLPRNIVAHVNIAEFTISLLRITLVGRIFVWVLYCINVGVPRALVTAGNWKFGRLMQIIHWNLTWNLQ